MDQLGRASASAGGNGSTATRAVDSATTSAHGAIDKASAAVKPAVDRITSGAHEAVDKVAGAASDAAVSLSAKATRLKDGQAQLTAQCRDYVNANPLMALGVALAAGFLLSRLLANR